MPADEQQRLLTAHAPPDCVDPIGVDPEPGSLGADDRRHPCEIVDLPLESPGVQWEASSHAAGTDDGEVTPARQAAPHARIRPSSNTASVRRDDERQGWRGIPRAVLRGCGDDRPAPYAVVRPVANSPGLRLATHAAPSVLPSGRAAVPARGPRVMCSSQPRGCSPQGTARGGRAEPRAVAGHLG